MYFKHNMREGAIALHIFILLEYLYIHHIPFHTLFSLFQAVAPLPQSQTLVF